MMIPRNPDLPPPHFLPSGGYITIPAGTLRAGDIIRVGGRVGSLGYAIVRKPKPTPKQYRLKRRAAGSKRRNKGRR